MNVTATPHRTSPAAASGAFDAVLQFVELEVAKMCAAEVASKTKGAATRH